MGVNVHNEQTDYRRIQANRGWTSASANNNNKHVPAQAALATSSFSFSLLPCAFSHSCEEPEARAFLIARSQSAAKPRPMFLVWGHSEKQEVQPGLRYLQ